MHPFKSSVHAIIKADSMFTETSLSNIAMIRKSPDALEQLLPEQKDKTIEEDPLKHENRPIVNRKQENDNKLEDVMVSKNIGKYTDLNKDRY